MLTPGAEATRNQEVIGRYQAVRRRTLDLVEPLEIEDFVLQSMVEASPPKWHLGHTTWFFETFLLEPFAADFVPFDPQFRVLFNSYYEQVGPQHPREERGLLSRPTVDTVFRYRAQVDERLCELLSSGSSADMGEILRRVEIGIHHEQQHQELLLMDLKHHFFKNPVRPAYRRDLPRATSEGVAPLSWCEHPGGQGEIGSDGRGFGYDNESPRHRVSLRPYALGNRLVTCGEWLEFMAEDGYERPELWLADGWHWSRQHRVEAPLYWERDCDRWQLFTLGGMRQVDPAEPVVHVSYYEADAYARWRGFRLATEAEWEVFASALPVSGNLMESGRLHPVSLGQSERPAQFFGDGWEWTQSHHSPYQGFRAVEGALGEYNGKFMCNQFVQRGGSALTPGSHIRASYRNFFYPHQRWNMQGLRLARDLD